MKTIYFCLSLDPILYYLLLINNFLCPIIIKNFPPPSLPLEPHFISILNVLLINMGNTPHNP